VTTGKPVFLRPLAERDIEEAIQNYRREGGGPLAAKWAEAIESALRHIGAHPASGSPRYAAQLKLAGLRFWSVRRFPYLMFYVEHADHVDVWRVLHGARDLPAWLRDEA
jgi:toxin ParE1/3/4